MSEVYIFVPYIRAKTSDGHYVSVAIEDLDERSFRRVVLSALCRTGVLVGAKTTEDLELTTQLTRAQVEAAGPAESTADERGDAHDE